MKKTISVSLLLLVVLGSGYAPSDRYKWIFTTKRCSNNNIPAYSNTTTRANSTPSAGTSSTTNTGASRTPNTDTSSTPTTGASRTPNIDTSSTPNTDTSSTPNTGASRTPSLRASSTPTTGANSTPNTGTSSPSGSWNRLSSILLSVYDAKIVEGDRHLLVIESDKKHEENIRQLICDYWKE